MATIVAATLLSPAAWAHGSDDGAAHADHGAETHDAGLSLPDADAAWQAGDMTVTAPYSRATLPNAPVAGGFLTITNDGATDDRLVAASTDIAGRTEIHQMTMDGDVMTMGALEDGLPIAAGQAVTLEPGGYHLMFMQLDGPLVEGDTVEVTLTFETAGDLTVPLSIQAFNARAAAPHGTDPHAGH
ncbi:copper chaperone PCu(A)C [Paracoccus sp. Ld10]|uniref:copper chaperone PCu(A)C n=1 Tax=Paracoccus sp. Ld10 TaxID=649158 RepID=UPI00386C2897